MASSTERESRLLTTIETEQYVEAKLMWPRQGRHILAQFDEKSIIVYQAFNCEIAEYAVQHQSFQGCKVYSPARMTWIKTNFLWMMYRSGWAKKDKNQSRILALRLKRDFFDSLLANCIHSKWYPERYPSQKAYNVANAQMKASGSFVRCQWDPDHHPNGGKVPFRRAVQLGLKKVPGFANGDGILSIEDITPFVNQQRLILERKGVEELVVPRERVYTPTPAAGRNVLISEYVPVDNQQNADIKRATSEEEKTDEKVDSSDSLHGWFIVRKMGGVDAEWITDLIRPLVDEAALHSIDEDKYYLVVRNNIDSVANVICKLHEDGTEICTVEDFFRHSYRMGLPQSVQFARL